jgi:hypothetical protein
MVFLADYFRLLFFTLTEQSAAIFALSLLFIIVITQIMKSNLAGLQFTRKSGFSFVGGTVTTK